MLFKFIKSAITLIIASICLVPALTEEAINIGNYPCIGLSVDTLDGVGILSDSNDEKGAGLGLFGDIGVKINFKPLNFLYLIKKDGEYLPVTSSYINIFGFYKIKDKLYRGTDEKNYDKSYTFNSFENLAGGGLYFELPLITTEKMSLFIEPNFGYDFFNKRTEFNLFAGLNLIDLNNKYLNFQTNFGIGIGNTGEDSIFSNLMVFVSCKLNHDFGHSRYFKAAEKYKNDELEKQRKHQEYLAKKWTEKQEKLNSYRKNFTVYNNLLYPLLYGSSADVIRLTASHPNFIKNAPYSFEKSCYYSIEPNSGEIIQWLDKETCLFSFKEYNYYWYGKTYFGLAYVHFDTNKTSYPFDKYNIIYKYTGVFEYTTANGSFNTVPKFEAVYSVGNY